MNFVRQVAIPGGSVGRSCLADPSSLLGGMCSGVSETMKVAIVHDWLVSMRGGERCFEVLCEIFPEADVFTLVHRKGYVSPVIEKHTIHTSFVQRLPFSASQYQYYLPIFPSAIEHFNLTGYDLVVSSSHCVAKGIRVPKDTYHLSYVYTPMRYIWDQFDIYFSKTKQRNI